METSKELPHTERETLLTRRSMLIGSLIVLANLSFWLFLWRRAHQDEVSYSFDGPFEKRDRLNFEKSDHPGIPFVPASVRIGNNDVTLWYYPKLTQDTPVNVEASLELYDQEGRVLMHPTRIASVVWSEEAAFDGCNIHFRADKNLLEQAHRLVFRLHEL